jgi:hypothetical protein
MAVRSEVGLSNYWLVDAYAHSLFVKGRGDLLSQSTSGDNEKRH